MRLEYKQCYVDWLCQVMELAKKTSFEALKPRDTHALTDDVIMTDDVLKSDDVMQDNGGEEDIAIMYRDVNSGSPGSDRNDIRCSNFRSELSGRLSLFVHCNY